ncbi:uncharacterized protein LOC117222693 isoform X1 [Megalopta genalis]|uniref:uncharacterized protein LOC117222693 isoform X1 n=1 Tax=Megalopta genalis TaxID=115081 RepID=UPI001443559B|nr:uncharacterized protein LOC117222693 isoform X1 [Megalopta genalis]
MINEQTVCCGCFESILVDERKNIFDDNLWISIHQYTENFKETNESMKQMKLSDCIELITGRKIVRMNQKLVDLCPKCFQNVQSYINFRTRLLLSLCSEKDENKSTNLIQSEKDSCLLGNTTTNDNKLLKEETLAECAVNIVESDIPLYSIIDNNNSIDNINELGNEQENKASNDLENSRINFGTSISWHIDLKHQDTDIESEIDVCSGEDEEVLELDDQKRTINIIEIDTSSESDIEVCDYEPIGKRFKKYQVFSPHLLF